MKNNEVLDFMKSIDEDEKLKQKITKITEEIKTIENPEDAKAKLLKEFVSLAKSKGYNISEQEFIKFFKAEFKDQSRNAELTDDELENASGGWSFFHQVMGMLTTGVGTLLTVGSSLLGGNGANKRRDDNRPSYVLDIDANQEKRNSTNKSNNESQLEHVNGKLNDAEQCASDILRDNTIKEKQITKGGKDVDDLEGWGEWLKHKGNFDKNDVNYRRRIELNNLDDKIQKYNEKHNTNINKEDVCDAIAKLAHNLKTRATETSMGGWNVSELKLITQDKKLIETIDNYKKTHEGKEDACKTKITIVRKESSEKKDENDNKTELEEKKETIENKEKDKNNAEKILKKEEKKGKELERQILNAGETEDNLDLINDINKQETTENENNKNETQTNETGIGQKEIKEKIKDDNDIDNKKTMYKDNLKGMQKNFDLKFGEEQKKIWEDNEHQTSLKGGTNNEQQIIEKNVKNKNKENDNSSLENVDNIIEKNQKETNDNLNISNEAEMRKKNDNNNEEVKNIIPEKIENKTENNNEQDQQALNTIITQLTETDVKNNTQDNNKENENIKKEIPEKIANMTTDTKENVNPNQEKINEESANIDNNLNEEIRINQNDEQKKNENTEKLRDNEDNKEKKKNQEGTKKNNQKDETDNNNENRNEIALNQENIAEQRKKDNKNDEIQNQNKENNLNDETSDNKKDNDTDNNNQNQQDNKKKETNNNNIDENKKIENKENKEQNDENQEQIEENNSDKQKDSANITENAENNKDEKIAENNNEQDQNNKENNEKAKNNEIIEENQNANKQETEKKEDNLEKKEEKNNIEIKEKETNEKNNQNNDELIEEDKKVGVEKKKDEKEEDEKDEDDNEDNKENEENDENEEELTKVQKYIEAALKNEENVQYENATWNEKKQYYETTANIPLRDKDKTAAEEVIKEIIDYTEKYYVAEKDEYDYSACQFKLTGQELNAEALNENLIKDESDWRIIEGENKKEYILFDSTSEPNKELKEQDESAQNAKKDGDKLWQTTDKNYSNYTNKGNNKYAYTTTITPEQTDTADETYWKALGKNLRDHMNNEDYSTKPRNTDKRVSYGYEYMYNIVSIDTTNLDEKRRKQLLAGLEQQKEDNNFDIKVQDEVITLTKKENAKDENEDDYEDNDGDEYIADMNI